MIKYYTTIYVLSSLRVLSKLPAAKQQIMPPHRIRPPAQLICTCTRGVYVLLVKFTVCVCVFVCESVSLLQVEEELIR